MHPEQRRAVATARDALRSIALAASLVIGLGCGRSGPPPPVDASPAASSQRGPRECSGQPCCGEPPRPCGQVLDESIGKPCTTACDCAFPGLACHEGRCRSGTEAVYCCDACPAQAPQAQRCQKRDGAYSTCGS